MKATLSESGPGVIASVAGTAMVLALTFLGLRLAAHDGNSSHWVRAGENYVDASELPDDFFQEDGLGYDGQFYYRVARAPLSTDRRVDGITFDRPAFRHQRLGYPVAAWALSGGGRQGLVPWALPAVNVIAVGAAAAAAAALLRRRGLAAPLALAVAVVPGTVMALSFDLAEATEAALLVSALLFLDQRRDVAAAIAMSWAAITRETALVLPIALLVCAGLRSLAVARRWRLAGERPMRPWVAGAPLVVYAGVQIVMARAWPTERGGASRTLEHARVPLEGLIDAVLSLGDRTPSDFLAVVLVVTIGVVGLLTLRDREAGAPHERVALLGATILPVTLGDWERPVVYLRHPTVWLLFAIVVAISSKPRPGSLPLGRIAFGAAALLAGLSASMVGAIPDDDARATDRTAPVEVSAASSLEVSSAHVP